MHPRPRTVTAGAALLLVASAVLCLRGRDFGRWAAVTVGILLAVGLIVLMGKRSSAWFYDED